MKNVHRQPDLRGHTLHVVKLLYHIVETISNGDFEQKRMNSPYGIRVN